MCFSANASFGAGAVLTVAGVVTLTKVKKPSQLLFAAIPLLFAIQQIIEGFTWVTLLHPAYNNWQHTAINAFLFFAHVLWPVCVPLSVWLLEKNETRKKILSVILVIAIGLSFSELYCLVFYESGAIVMMHHIKYEIHFSVAYATVTEVLYITTTLVPCFISTVKRMWLFGYSLTLTLVMSAIFYKYYVVSVWCFFAAITSVVIYFVISGPIKFKKIKSV